MIFALVGNQNCGKTTLFNALTGSNRHVGNFPGVTMDTKTGAIRGSKGNFVVDLPGIYSIRPYSNDEIISRDFIINEKPDGIINIVDATNIERNLYLTLQLLELQIPTVIALNMMDEIRGNGGTIDIAGMSKLLGVPVIPISAAKKEGISELIKSAIDTAEKKRLPAVTDFCLPGPVHRCIHSISHVIEDHAQRIGISRRYAATKLIEGDDKEFIDRLDLSQNEHELIEHSIIEMENERGLDRNAALADMRYAFVEDVCRLTVVKNRVSKESLRSDKIDKLLTNKYAALPVFFSIMVLIFWLTFGVIGNFLSELLSRDIDLLAAAVDKGLTAYGINPAVHSLVIDGLFAGVGSVISFLPLIVVLFFFLSVLEDTGYMARVAFVMDKLLRRLGLSGRSFVPMIIGFGCSVPAIMATRTLSSERDRKMTVLLMPFMSCSAKIPIYAVFSAAFFPGRAALVMAILYISGIAAGILVAALLNKTAFRGKPIPFVMELPNYRVPSLRTTILLMWEKARDFLRKAFTVILLATIIIWFLGAFDSQLNFTGESSQSLLASIGRLMAPIFRPLGFDDWRIATPLVVGFTAKEAVISTLGVLIGSSASALDTALPALFSSLSAVSFLVFTLLYTPCGAAVAAMKRELGSWLQTVAAVVGQCLIAWIFAFAFYRVGGLIF